MEQAEEYNELKITYGLRHPEFLKRREALAD
jgi:hypothetical protein